MSSFIFASMMILSQIGLIGYTIEMRALGLTDSPEPADSHLGNQRLRRLF